MNLESNKIDTIPSQIANNKVIAIEYNQIAGSLMVVQNAAGLTPDASDNTQLLTAIQTLILNEVNKMLGRPDYSSGIEGSVVSPSSTYTCPSKGYLFLKSANTTGVQAAINGISVAISENYEHSGTNPTINLMIPVSQGDILSVVGTGTGRTIYFSFCPEETNI